MIRARTPAARPARPQGTHAVRRLLRQPRAPWVARRAVCATIAGCTGFYTCTYGFGDSLMGLYALFGSLPLVMFSHVPGPARQRTRTLLAVLPVACLLVTAGTLLAVRDWAAACGMFVVGFAVSFAGVGGPRLAGIGVACQLYYVLPCFPPYAPDTLGSRLAGLSAGILLTAAVDRLLPAEPPPVPYRLRLADATAAVARGCATAAEGAEDTRAAADRALEAARPSRLPPTERPISPSARDRALNHTRAAVRHVRDQLDRLYGAPGGPPAAGPEAMALLRRTADTLRPVAAGLRRGAPSDEAAGLAAAVADFDAARVRGLPGASPLRLRQDAVAKSAAAGALLAARASRIALGARPAHEAPAGEWPFLYAAVPAPELWWRRLRLHLTPRSVYLQNALRVAVALAAARLLAGALGLSHGFWVLLATLSLMRTSAADTRTALRPAFLGTAAGAAVAAAMLAAVGNVPVFYAAALPVVLLVGFTVAPLLGPAYEQAVFTLVLVLLFTQLSTADWQLPAVRILDVLVGGTLGAAASLLAWPHGGHGELRGALAGFLTEAAAGCRAVTDRLCGRPGPADPLRSARRAMLLAEATYCQYQTERMPRRTAEPHWDLVLAAGYHLLRGGELMLMRRPDGAGPAPLPPEAAAELTALAVRVADDCGRCAHALRSGTAPSAPARDPGPAPLPADTSGPLCRAALRAADSDPAPVLLAVDAEAWLTGVAQDLARIR
ncbi:FUSC family protein [Streptomyces sp. NPDC021096]|uniref:FUSC family protein n=1 Tax=Streptomyces sp. NPDC021096 TaxID=3154792 RepID=UPI00340E70C7